MHRFHVHPKAQFDGGLFLLFIFNILLPFFSSNIVLSSGSEFSEDNFVVKVKMEIVVSKDQV